MPDDSPVNSLAPTVSETELSSVFIEDMFHLQMSPSPTPSSASSLPIATKEDHQKTVDKDVAEVEAGVAATNTANIAVNEDNGIIIGNSGLMDVATRVTNPTGKMVKGTPDVENEKTVKSTPNVENEKMVEGTPNVENGKMIEGTSAISGERHSMGKKSGGGGDMVKSFNPL